MEALVKSGHAQDAVDIGVPVALAAYPNGGSLFTMYTFLKYSSKFLNESQKNGVKNGLKEVGKDAIVSEVSSEAGEELVSEAQTTVNHAAQTDIMKRGVDKANKNLSDPAQRAAGSMISEISTQGADALTGVKNKDDQRDE